MEHAVLSAALTGLAVRGWLPGEVACIALVPTLIALHREVRPLRAGALVAVAHLGLLLAAFEGALPAIAWALPLAVASFALAGSLPGVLSCALRRTGSASLALWSLPFSWTALEFVLGGQWLWRGAASPVALGYTQVDTPLLALARLAGVSGLTFAILALNVALAHSLLTHNWWPVLLTVIAVSLPTLHATVGSGTSAEYSGPTVGLVQPSLDPDWYEASLWSERAGEMVLTKLVDLSAGLGMPVDLLVWPEAAIPSIIDPASLPNRLAGLPFANHDLIAGVVRDFQGARYNSALHLAGGEVVPIYDKLTPVPLGERGISAGKSLTVARLADTWVGVLICLDSAYSALSLRLARFGAEVLLVLSDDSFSRGMATPRLHLRSSVVRAVESGLPLIFANASGPSAIVTPAGRITVATTVGEITSLAGRVPDPAPAPFYVRHGDLLGPLCLLVTALLHVLSLSRGWAGSSGRWFSLPRIAGFS